MKILVIASTLDLKYRLGCTPSWWQLFKALYETGNEVIVVPYLGEPVESLWWRTYPNPCSKESIIYNAHLNSLKNKGISPSGKNILTPASKYLINNYINPKWKRHVMYILRKEQDIDTVLIMNVPINHFNGVPSAIKKIAKIPVIYYDGDMPTSLPKYTVSRGFKFNYYEGADLTEYDAFLTNSEGCIPDLQEMGAGNVHPFHYAIDPELCKPIEAEKDIDIFFFGYGSDFREEWMNKLIAEPSRQMPDARFVVGGKGFNIDLGNAELVGDLTYSEMREYVCRSKINLNITRWSHTSVYASSTARPFELAAFEACIVSQPYNGIEKWFEPGNEILLVSDRDQANLFFNELLSKDKRIYIIGKNARIKVLRKHSYIRRATQLTEIIDSSYGQLLFDCEHA